MHLSTVPVELKTRILSFSGAPDIISFSRTCKDHHRLVDSSAELKYTISLFYNGCVHEPARSGPLSFGERLTRLRTREKRWGAFDLKQRAARLDVPFMNSGLYDIGNGLFAAQATGGEEYEIKVLNLRDFSKASPPRRSSPMETPAEEQTLTGDSQALPLLPQAWHSLTLGRNVVEWQAITAVDEYDLVVAIALEHSPTDPTCISNLSLL